MKIKVTNLKTTLVEIISILLMVLFVYSALSKLLEFQNFQAQLGQSPLISAYTASDAALRRELTDFSGLIDQGALFAVFARNSRFPSFGGQILL